MLLLLRASAADPGHSRLFPAIGLTLKNWQRLAVPQGGTVVGAAASAVPGQPWPAAKPSAQRPAQPRPAREKGYLSGRAVGSEQQAARGP